MYAKITDNRIEYPPRNADNMMNVDRNPAWLMEHGYTDMTPEELAPYQPTVATPPTRYSKYKIVEKMGDQWSALKARLEAAGYWELWNSANELSTADANFSAFLATLSDAEKAAHAECIAD